MTDGPAVGAAHVRAAKVHGQGPREESPASEAPSEDRARSGAAVRTGSSVETLEGTDARRGGSVAGRVILADGTGAAGVVVEVVEAPARTNPRTAETDEGVEEARADCAVLTH